MYAQDSFFTLTTGGQIGLALSSVNLSGLSVLITRRLAKDRPLLLQPLIGLICFFIFVWLSPQVYYTYYIYLLEGLPWQVVVQHPPGPGHLFNLLTFQDRANLSHHSQGVLGWILIVAACWHNRRG